MPPTLGAPPIAATPAPTTLSVPAATLAHARAHTHAHVRRHPCGAGAMAVLFARLISRPIRRLTEAAVGVAEGDLGARADIRSRDEIGALASAVTTMTDTLVEANSVEA